MKGNIVPLPTRAPTVGAQYRHYKGDIYRVTQIALHSNDHEWMVVYEPCYDNPIAPCFTRPLCEWFEEVVWEGERVERFTLV